MKKRYVKKLTLNRETVRRLDADHVKKAQAAGQLVRWSDPPECDPACTSQTLSCTL